MKELKNQYALDNLQMRIEDHFAFFSEIHLEIIYTYFDGDNDLLETGEILVNIDAHDIDNTSFEKRFYSFALDEDSEDIGYVPDNLNLREIKLLMEIVEEVRDFYAAQEIIKSQRLVRLQNKHKNLNDIKQDKEYRMFEAINTMRDEIEELEREIKETLDEIKELKGESHNVGNRSL